MVLNNINSYKVYYRNIKYPRVEFKTGSLVLILPLNQDPEAVFERHKEWILKKSLFIEECLNNIKDIELVKRTEKEFRKYIFSLVKKINNELKVSISNISFRKMKTKWASISSSNNLTVNKLVRYLPEHLIEYIIYHELTHLIEKRHNEKFWKIIYNKFENFKYLEKELFSYWFLVSKYILKMKL